MPSIMTSVGGPASLVAGLLFACAAWGSDIAASGTANAIPGAYSLSYDKDKWTDDFSVFHMAVADQLGVLDSGFAASDDPRLRPLTRLDSAWNLTAPLLGLPMRIGDGVSSTGFWDQPARLGGIQLGSYQPRPPEVVAPPSLIALPYEVIGPGPATGRFIDHLRTLVQSENQSLAAAGQADFSLESGRLRENFEVHSNDYGPWITSGTYRYGLNVATTLDGQIAQVAGQQSFLGLGVLEGLGPLGMLSARLASSRDTDSSGWLARVGYDYSHDRVNVAVQSHLQSPGFQAVGDSSLVESYRQRTLASTGFDLGALGRISLASAIQTYTDDSRRDIVAVSHAMAFGNGGIISTAAAYSPGQLGNAALLLSFTYPFDARAPARKLSNRVNSALDRTIVDAFDQTRLPGSGRLSDNTDQATRGEFSIH